MRLCAPDSVNQRMNSYRAPLTAYVRRQRERGINAPMRISKLEREKQKTEAIDYLRSILSAGSTVFLSLKNVSRSGMSRTIACYAKDGEDIRDVSWQVAKACEYRYADKNYLAGVMVSGCGMDMGLALVDSLSYALYGVPCDQTTGLREEYRKPNGGLGYRWL